MPVTHGSRRRWNTDLALLVLSFALLQTVGNEASAADRAPSCAVALSRGNAVFETRIALKGTVPALSAIPLATGHEWLVEAREQGNDALLEILDASGNVIARADHPERRTGTRRIIMSPRDSQPLKFRVTGKEHESVNGTVEIRAFETSGLSSVPNCARVYALLAAADGDYAIAQQISHGRVTGAAQSAHDAYIHADADYVAAQSLLGDSTDAMLKGEVALAIAGIRYFDLDDWRGSAEWAMKARNLLKFHDPYRNARAQALLAAAWIEMPDDSTLRASGREYLGAKARFSEARRILRRLYAFHRRRKEWYDAALQMNNIGLTGLYDGGLRECVLASQSAARIFARLGEVPRQAVAQQNGALCDWGLGRLPEALAAFNRALAEMTPDPYPQLYLATLNNTALISFALGRFDDSLRLHDRARDLAIHTQKRRDEAQSLYGIGVTYYALGDKVLAREFLTRSLSIRTAELDPRGRRATLRSLATLYADLGEYRHAIDLDREALALATDPISRARGRLQLAVHTGADGNRLQAAQMLAELLRPRATPDPLLRAQILLEHAAIERQAGRYLAALGDVAKATPIIERFDSIMDAFAADLERARDLRALGNQSGALAAVEKALQRSPSIRRQSANPEFRAQLQLPLRAAYDLKLDLLWDRHSAAMKKGQTREAARIAAAAFQSADSARAQSFNDIAAQHFSTGIRRELAKQFELRENLYRKLAGLRFALDAFIDRHGSTDPRGRDFEEQIAAVEQQIHMLDTTIAARTASRRAPSSASEARATDARMPLPADSTVISYWLGNPFAYAWVATPTDVHWVRLPSSAAIASDAEAFHDSLTRLGGVPRQRRLEASASLYAHIIRPVIDWAAPYRRWFVIPDGALAYVPFGALRDDAGADAGYLVNLHDLAMAPAAWILLAASPRPEASVDRSRIMLVSDPVYERSDPRINARAAAAANPGLNNPSAASTLELHQTYRRIPGTAREAAVIGSQFPAAAIDSFSGPDATRDRLLQLDWSQYRYIHIATHGHVDARIPQLSALILSSYDRSGARIDDTLRASDLADLTLTADLVVFSGCDTALGKNVSNEGMVGITYSTLARGANAVVSSLWPVPDEIGANLMTDFYRRLVRDSMSPMAAMSTAMRFALSRNPAADPALWAAFQVSVAAMTNAAPPAGRTVAVSR